MPSAAAAPSALDGVPASFVRGYIDNLRRRLILIRWIQLLGALSLLLCVVSMVSVMFDIQLLGVVCFISALTLMGASLVFLVLEIWYSGGALQILIKRVEEE